jgi:hypothetical protein
VPTFVPLREHFIQSERLSTAWTITKNGKTATCEVWSHVLGYELRASIGTDPVLTTVARSQNEVFRVQQEWRSAFASKGWSAK